MKNIHKALILTSSILMILKNVCFSVIERFIIKVHFLLMVVPLKKCNAEHDLLKSPRRASLKGLYAALLILTIDY